MVERGQAWERPAGTGEARLVAGGDRALADAVAAGPGGPLRFEPDPTSDLARALGLTGSRLGPPLEVDVDALGLDPAPDRGPALAVNAAIVGADPRRLRAWSPAAPVRVTIDGRVVYEGRAVTVVVANGQFLGGLDLVPRGHPGDGRAEIQVVDVPPGDRAEFSRRLGRGVHLPHPGVTQRSGRQVRIESGRPRRLEVDGEQRGRVRELLITVVPAACTLRIGGTRDGAH